MARRRCADDPLAVLRITSGKAVEGGRLEFEVEPADAADEARVLAAAQIWASATPPFACVGPSGMNTSPQPTAALEDFPRETVERDSARRTAREPRSAPGTSAGGRGWSPHRCLRG